MFNAQKFEIEYSSPDIVAYMITITKTDLGELKTGLEALVISSVYFDLAYVYSEVVVNNLPN